MESYFLKIVKQVLNVELTFEYFPEVWFMGILFLYLKRSRMIYFTKKKKECRNPVFGVVKTQKLFCKMRNN